jgi:hypothetical protein
MCEQGIYITWAYVNTSVCMASIRCFFRMHLFRFVYMCVRLQIVARFYLNPWWKHEIHDVHAFVCVGLWVWVLVCAFVCVRMCVCVCLCVYVCACVCMWVFVSVNVCVSCTFLFYCAKRRCWLQCNQTLLLKKECNIFSETSLTSQLIPSLSIFIYLNIRDAFATRY